jgi:hypothetical protein
LLKEILGSAFDDEERGAPTDVPMEVVKILQLLAMSPIFAPVINIAQNGGGLQL